MFEHRVVLKIDVAESDAPQVRMWIDDQRTSDLSSEREIALVRETGSVWSAEFDVEGPFIYRVGIVATPGCRWSLSFRSVSEDEELLFDSDELTMTKEWLVGTCDTLDAITQHVGRDGRSGLQLFSS